MPMDRRHSGTRALMSAIHEIPAPDDDVQPRASYALESRCSVCQLPEEKRLRVDAALMEGWSYRRALEEAGDGSEDGHVSLQAVGRHARRHVSFHDRILREIVEARAKERGLDVAQASERLLSTSAFFEVIFRETFRRVRTGELRPSVSDGLRAALALQELESSAGDAWSPERARAEVAGLVEAVWVAVPQEFHGRVRDRIMAMKRDRASLMEANWGGGFDSDDQP